MRVARSSEQAALAQSVAGKAGRVTEEYRIDLSQVPPEMRDPLLLEGGFHGELEVFLRSLTDAVGWAAPVILGNKPSTPLMVAFTEQRRPAVYWFADAGYQSSELAKVTINSSLKQVVLHYREAGGIR
nr:DotD/TraH family lipoprotein [Stutzerimonas stutzeri]